LTNCFELEALLIAQIYRRRWGIELFWRWTKQHLRLRGCFNTSPNGLRVQIWAVLRAYLLVAIAKRQNISTRRSRKFCRSSASARLGQ
jgi:IS4 transposase